MSNEEKVVSTEKKKPGPKPGNSKKNKSVKEEDKLIDQKVNENSKMKEKENQAEQKDTVVENKKPAGVSLSIDRVYFHSDVMVIINGKRQPCRMIMSDKTQMQFTDDGFLLVISKGVTRIHPTSISSVLYK